MNKQHINLNTPCCEVATKRRPAVNIVREGGTTSKTLARIVCLSYANLPLDTQGGSVCHACNNYRCINPLHLYLGTQADNTRDSVEAGTHYTNPLLGSYNTNSTALWRCVSPSGTEVYRIGLKRSAAQGGCSIASVSASYTKQRATKQGWRFYKIRTLYSKQQPNIVL